MVLMSGVVTNTVELRNIDNGQASSTLHSIDDIDSDGESTASLIEKSINFENNILKVMNNNLRKKIFTLEDIIFQFEDSDSNKSKEQTVERIMDMVRALQITMNDSFKILFTEIKDIRLKLVCIERQIFSQKREGDTKKKTTLLKTTTDLDEGISVSHDKELLKYIDKTYTQWTEINHNEKLQTMTVSSAKKLPVKSTTTSESTNLLKPVEQPEELHHNIFKGDNSCSENDTSLNTQIQEQEKHKHPKSHLFRPKKFQGEAVVDENSGAFLGKKSPNSRNKKIWLFISRVQDHVSSDIVANFIANKTGQDQTTISVKLLEIHKNDADNKCFLVGVDPLLKDDVYKTSFWPKGVSFSRFDFKLGQRFLDC
mgnify:CR=1 FL=1